MWLGLLGVSLVLMTIGLLMIFLTVFKAYLKFVFRGLKKWIEAISFYFFYLFDKKFVVDKGKSVPYKDEIQIRIEAEEVRKQTLYADRSAKEFLGAVNFVESLKVKYPMADEYLFHNMTENVLNAKNINIFKELEETVKHSHNTNKAN
ncbi:MAG: hypothetical protein K0R18_39 [Bacillales bacterium]|jgi:hypothetical protein|nr:hypothetical protein [Bacillales bacterium]